MAEDLKPDSSNEEVLLAAPPQPARHDASWWGPRTVAGTSHTDKLTPERLASMLRQAEDGDPMRQAELAAEIEGRDPHLVGVLSKRKRAVASLPWQVLPASDRRGDKKIAEAVREMLKGVPQLRNALVHGLDAITKGYSALEIDWRMRPGHVSVAGLRFRPARWFRPDWQRPHEWRILDGGPIGEPLQPGAWIWHEAHAMSGATAAASALIRVLAWPWLFKWYALKDLAIFLETYNAPLRLGRYKPGTSEKDRNILYKALLNLGIDATAIIPEGVSIEFPSAADKASSANNYLLTAGYWDAAMSKGVLGETLTTEAGDRGSQSLGRVHDDVRRELRDSDAEQLAETWTRDLIQPFVVYQFGPQAAYPSFQFITDNPAELERRASLYKNLAPLGVRFPVRHIHETFGIPEPVGAEPTYEQSKTPSPGAAASERVRMSALAEGDGLELPPLSAELERAIRAALAQGGYAGWDQVVRHLRTYLDQAREPAEVSALLVQALEALDLSAVAEHLADELIRAELLARAQVRQGEQPLGDWPALPPRAASSWWQRKAAVTPEAWKKLTEEQRGNAFTVTQFSTLSAVSVIQQALQQALDQGESFATFEDRYNDALLANGMLPEDPWYTELVFRNNLGTAYCVGAYSEQRAPDVMAERPYWIYEAVGDLRTRETHAAMDGQVFPADHPIWQTWYPPNGHNCRCRVLSATAADVAERNLAVADTLPTWRPRRKDGSIGPAEPLIPDTGWRRNAALAPHEFDFSAFPADWRAALKVAS